MNQGTINTKFAIMKKPANQLTSFSMMATLEFNKLKDVKGL